MTALSKFIIEPATLEDIPALTSVWFAAFTDRDFRRMWPDTPGVRKWWEDNTRYDMLTRPFQKYLKVTDPTAVDANGRARIASFAKWDFAMISDRGRRYLPWHEDMAVEECDEFFLREDKERTRVMGDEKHYYLDTLATHPDYQRQGAGSMLLKWGCDVADRDGVGAYVDGSKDGAPLYSKFGFVDKSEGDSLVASMARPRT